MKRSGISHALSLPALTLATLLLAGCSAEPFYWYEEAQQDDGSVVMVKTVETGSSQSRIVPGAQIYGYRFIQIEFADPKTGRKFVWKPSRIPSLLPLALHFHDGVPFVFGKPYTGARFEYGCPFPPYLIFRWTGSGWIRIRIAELPVQFHRTNLLTNSGEKIDFDKTTFTVTKGMTVKAPMLDRSRFVPRGVEDEYFFKLDYRELNASSCNGQKNIPTKYDHLELK